MNRIFLLCALAIALLGSECSSDGDRNSQPATASEALGEATPVHPVPEPSGALIFGLGLLVTGIFYGAWKAGER